MNSEIFEKIIRFLNTDTENQGSYCMFSDKAYKPVKVSKDNFKEIKTANNKNKIAFIDGGNAEILSASNFSLQLIRLYYTIYEKNKRIKAEKFEFYLLINSLNDGGNIFYKTEIFPVNFDIESFSFDSYDATIKEGNNQISISKIGDVIRRFSEIKLALETAKDLEANDVIVLDGTLQANYTNEKNVLEMLYNEAEERGIIITALSKTSTLFTETGGSYIALLDGISPYKKWVYHPVAEINSEKHKAELFIVKLDERSSYNLRFEAYKNVKFDIAGIVSGLSLNASDPVLPGYPYGMIEADKFARITNEEKEALKMAFAVKAGKDWKKIAAFLNTRNLHEILDKMGF
ncbi:MAG: DNA double-strand break repair nuclease NurA [Candidatus Woesearchaeota archaeon]|nr:DNA double-strand break repair nuclease NurA [Candidatus Woesearchaeota archaeon]